MLPIKDASRPTAGQPDTPVARAADAPRPGGGSGAPSSGPPVASQRPSHSHTPHHQGHGHQASSHGPSHGPSHGSGPARRDPGRETKSAGSPNIQDVFLNYARREKLTVVIQLLDGQSVEGRIKNFDRFALIIDHAGVDHLVFKHAIATIRSPRSIGSYYASHEAT
jgi:host factor-I protein